MWWRGMPILDVLDEIDTPDMVDVKTYFEL
jgi:hypothetical protein